MPEARYFTGIPCSAGHVTQRYTSNRRCCACQAEAVRRNRTNNPARAKELQKKHGRLSYAKHRESRLAENSAYRCANREKIRQSRKATYERTKAKRISYNVAYGLRNPEKTLAWRRKYESSHPEKKRQRRRTYQARKVGSMPVWANLAAIESVYVEAKRLTEMTGIVHHVDHIIPLAGRNVCGLHVEYNLQAIPWIDNLRKGRRLTA